MSPSERIHDYLQAPGHGEGGDGPLLEAAKEPGGAGEDRLKPLTHGAVYHRVLREHAQAAGIDAKSFGPHALRATAATNALDRGTDLGKVQEWLSARQRLDHPALQGVFCLTPRKGIVGGLSIQKCQNRAI